MLTSLPLFPPTASSFATEVNLLYLFIAAVSAFFVVLVAALVLFFAIKYRRRNPDDVGADIHGSLVLELTWTIIPFILAMIMFVWGADLAFRMARPPSDSMNIYVVGKQWMWKIQHPEGVREINELHIPVGRDIRLTMGSEDVIHDFGIPAFRQKMDVVPGKLTTMWFMATEPGTYHIFCDQYCGTRHSAMVGDVIVMEPQAYQAWLTSGGVQASASSASPAQEGEQLFTANACVTCHKADGSGIGPSLGGVPGATVHLATGTVVADDDYLRESIMNSQAKIVKGYGPPSMMPLFQGMINEEQVMDLIAYIKTLPQTSTTGTSGK